jgi:hypothetical protein
MLALSNCAAAPAAAADTAGLDGHVRPIEPSQFVVSTQSPLSTDTQNGTITVTLNTTTTVTTLQKHNVLVDRYDGGASNRKPPPTPPPLPPLPLPPLAAFILFQNGLNAEPK